MTSEDFPVNRKLASDIYNIKPQPLSDLIDVDQLVTVHELRKRRLMPKVGFNLVPGSVANAFAGDRINEKVIIFTNIHKLSDEEVYVLIAHETAHFWQLPALCQSHEGKGYVYHHDKRCEQDAIYWEGLQAARMGWNRETHRAFIKKLGFRTRRIREQESWPAFPSLPPRRRVVQVRTHHRRRA